MKLAFTTSVAAACLFAAAAFAQGQPDFSQVQIKSTPLGNNTYMLEGQGGNMVIAVGGDGVIQVDTEFAPLQDKIKAEIDRWAGGSRSNMSHTHSRRSYRGMAASPRTARRCWNRNLALRIGTVRPPSRQKTEPR